MGVSTPQERNSKIACRNSVAPISATRRDPPTASINFTMAKAALRTSPDDAIDGDDMAGHMSEGRSIRACATNAQNIINVLCADKSPCVIIAR
jgi:hypothetical protein